MTETKTTDCPFVPINAATEGDLVARVTYTGTHWSQNINGKSKRVICRVDGRRVQKITRKMIVANGTGYCRATGDAKAGGGTPPGTAS